MARTVLYPCANGVISQVLASTKLPHFGGGIIKSAIYDRVDLADRKVVFALKRFAFEALRRPLHRNVRLS